MSENLSCRICNKHHMGGLSCFYGINRIEIKRKKKSSPRKLLKNKFRRLDSEISFKKFIKMQGKKNV